MNAKLILAAGLLFVLAYLPSVWLGLRRKKLHVPVRWFFAVTIFPIFVALMWLNLRVTNHVIPVEKIVSMAHGFDARHQDLTTALSLFGIDIEIMPLVAFVIAVPLAVLLAWLWYRLLVRIDGEVTVVTGLGARAKRMEQNIPLFLADRPFIFLIRDRRTGAILFVGRVMNPVG